MGEPVQSKNLFNYQPLGKLNEEAAKNEAMFKEKSADSVKTIGEIIAKGLDDHDACVEMVMKIIRPMSKMVATPQEYHKQYIDACNRTEMTVPIRDGNDVEVKVIVFTPKELAEDKKRVPFIYAHGGGAVATCTDDYAGFLCEAAVIFGVVVYGVDYRLGPETRAPKNALDFYCAIKHIKENADTLGLDSSRISISGDSGGGYICFAAMIMLARKDEGNIVKLAMPGVPMLDDCESIPLEKKVPQEKEQVAPMQMIWKCLAPDFNVDYSDALMFPLKATDEELSKVPPTIIWSKEFDIFVTASTMMAERLRKVGRLLEFVVHPGETHTSNIFSGSVLRNTYLNDFKLALQEYLF